MSDDANERRKKSMWAAKESIIYGRDYDVGYARPPEASQWKKGQSGNPKGRPARAGGAAGEDDERMRKAFLDHLRRKIKVTEGGEEREIEIVDAVTRSQQQSALRGNAVAQRDILDRAERMMAAEAREIEEQNRGARAYQQRCWDEIAEAKKNKRPEPAFDVHPDDMVIRDGCRIEYIGPVGQTEQAQVAQTVGYRDALIRQAALEWKLYPDDDAKPVLKRHRSAHAMAYNINKSLPVRFQLAEFELHTRIDRHSRTSKRVLLKETRRAWWAIGCRALRGRMLPTLGVMRSWNEENRKLIRQFLQKLKIKGEI